MNRSLPLYLLLVLWCFPCYANNTFFLPGDAFFYFRADKNTIGYLDSEKDPIVSYGAHWDGGVGCGFAGFHELKLPDLSKHYVNGLKTAYREMLSEIEASEAIEDNKISVFVYNQDFDWQKHHLALQYNENWAAETVMFGHRPGFVRLESFVSGARLISISWRDSAKIAPLKVNTPQVAPKTQGYFQEQPAVIAGKFKLIVIPNRKFNEYSSKSTTKLRLFEITENFTREYISSHVEWKLVKTHSKPE